MFDDSVLQHVHNVSIGLYHLELAVWNAGVVMGRDTWNRKTSLTVLYMWFMKRLTNDLCFR
ncbi:hypothetical protein HanXRQr2_Chr16g0748311 [Helianthus annuus]|uniref:Uncharacterized protein n=1 Tax=Helianthus annuus TaxID=4232 RepID=A0A9K3DR25_HELAN|nr:hypothetical protein HanXRQr2_Chr16g0748311 [Helianthus annuus]